MKKLRLLATVMTAASALALGACGTTEAPASAESTQAGGSVSIVDARGKTVTLDHPATRLVGTEWNVVENIASLGVMPVGAADTKGYSEWVQAVKLTSSVKDIGTRGEPSIDTVAALSPDLIVATTDLPEAAVTQLEALAPVVVLKSADASEQIAQATKNLEQIATLTGKESQATEVINKYTSAITTGKAALKAAGLEGSRVAFADGWVVDGAISIRPFVKGSLMSDINAELGLVDPWTLKGDAAYGLAQTDVEGLTNLKTDSFVYITNSADDSLTKALDANSVWKSLSFVKSGDVHQLGDGIWMFGGPASMTQYANALVASLTAK